MLDAASSKNVTVTKFSPNGIVCVDVTTPQAPRNVVAMIDNSGADPATAKIAGSVDSGAVSSLLCPAGSDAEIATVGGTAGALKPFYVTFN